jgi:hypothetical protein
MATGRRQIQQAGFASEPKVLCLKFNAGASKVSRTPKVALIEGSVTGLIENGPALTRATVAEERLSPDRLAQRRQEGSFNASPEYRRRTKISSVIGILERGFVPHFAEHSSVSRPRLDRLHDLRLYVSRTEPDLFSHAPVRFDRFRPGLQRVSSSEWSINGGGSA